MKPRQKKLASRGICIKCDARPAAGRHVTCKTCRLHAAEWVASNLDHYREQYRRRKNAGLCPACGAEHNSETVCCPSCREMQNTSQKKRYRRRRHAGVCPMCGDDHNAETVWCPACQEKNNEYKRQSTEKTQ